MSDDHLVACFQVGTWSKPPKLLVQGVAADCPRAAITIVADTLQKMLGTPWLSVRPRSALWPTFLLSLIHI